jgi:hypothetical protein
MPRRKTPDTDARLAELKAATRAIGSTPTSRLAWVVKFINDDPTQWHPAVRTAYGDCLYAVASSGSFGVLASADPDELPDTMPGEEVEAVHRDLRATLRDLVGKNPTRAQMVDIPTEGTTVGLIRLTAAGVKPAMFATSHGHKYARVAIFQAAKDLILQAGERLIACPICGAPFLYNRKQLFCGIRCAQKARNDRREEARPRKTERRRRKEGG